MNEPIRIGASRPYRLAGAMTPLVAAALAAACQTPPQVAPVGAPTRCAPEDQRRADLLSRGPDYDRFRIVAPGGGAITLSGAALSADHAVESLQVPDGARLYRIRPPP